MSNLDFCILEEAGRSQQVPTVRGISPHSEDEIKCFHPNCVLIYLKIPFFFRFIVLVKEESGL